MTLMGEGIICILHDIKAEGVDDFYAWHDTEHMPERVGIPEFLRGRRYIVEGEGVGWLTLYETVSPQVLSGQDYLNRLNNPTAWTVAVGPWFSNVSRSLTRKAYSIAHADGAYVLAFGLTSGDDIADLRRQMTGDVLPKLYAGGGLLGVHWLETDRSASGILTEEKKSRSGGIAVADAVVLVEASRTTPLAKARSAVSEALGDVDGVGHIFPPAVYRVEYEKQKLSL